MVTKPLRGVSTLNSSLANTSKSSCDSVSSTASAAPRLMATDRSRPSATSTPERLGGSKLVRTKSLNPATRPAPVPRRTGTARQSIASNVSMRPSIASAQPVNVNPASEAKPATKLVSQATLKRRLSVASAAKSVLDQKMPSSAAAAKPPPGGQSRKPARPASAADNNLARKK